MMIDPCVFCDKPASTREHIPAENLFTGSDKNNLITVPSCSTCNPSYHLDEDFFRQFWASMLMESSPAANRLMADNAPIVRSIKRRPALASQMFSQMELIDIYDQLGNFRRKATAYHISDADRERINRVVRKVVTGLFFHRFNKKIPKDWSISVDWFTPEMRSKSQEILTNTVWTWVNKEIFGYGVGYVPDTYQSVWCLEFFGKPLFLSFVLDPVTASTKRNTNS